MTFKKQISGEAKDSVKRNLNFTSVQSPVVTDYSDVKQKKLQHHAKLILNFDETMLGTPGRPIISNSAMYSENGEKTSHAIPNFSGPTPRVTQQGKVS